MVFVEWTLFLLGWGRFNDKTLQPQQLLPFDFRTRELCSCFLGEVNRVLTRRLMFFRNVVVKCFSPHSYRRMPTDSANRLNFPSFTETAVFADARRLRLFTVTSALL